MTRKLSIYTLRTEHLAWQGANDGRIAKVFLSEGSGRLHSGNYYIIAEISQPSQDGEFLLTSLASTILKEDRLRTHTAQEERFEELILRANTLLKNMGGETSNTWFGNTHIVFALYTEQKLFISTVGNPMIFLIRGEKITGVVKKPKEQDGLTATRFEHIIKGEIYPGDAILMVSPGVFELFSPEHFEHLVKKYKGLPLSDLDGLLKEHKEKADTPFASLVLRLETQPAPPSASKLRISRTPRNRVLRIINIFKGSTKNAFNRLPRKLPTLSSRIPPIHSLHSHFPPNKILLPFSFFRGRMNTRRSLTILFILAILVALTGLIIIKKDRDARTELASLLDSIKINIGDAENALIFNDAEGALTRLIEAQSLLSRIERDKASSDELRQLEGALRQLEDKILGTVMIENPRIVWEIKQTLGVPPSDLFITENSLFVYSERQAIIYRQGEPQKLLFLPVTARISNAPGVFIPSSSRFFWYSEEGVHSFDSLTETDDLWEGVPPGLQVADIQYYRTFLYILTREGKILKYRQDAAGFSDMGEWLKETLNTSPPSSFAVDGSIYIMGDARAIIKLVNGKIVERWNIPLDLVNAGIVASENLSHIYIIDREGNSILRLSKDGKITKRYKSSKFNALKNIWVNERENKLTILNNSLVYEVDL